MQTKKTICVYCSSSNHLAEKYYKLSEQFGQRLGKSGYDMVYGGTVVGMMGVIADNAIKAGANVTGVIPERIASFGLKHPEPMKVIVTKDMRERKATMEKYADAFVAMPGGFGTFEEIFEIIVAKQLSYHDKPIVFMNFDNYYQNLFKMFETVYENKFAKEETRALYYISDNIEDIFNYINTYKPEKFVLKW